MESHENFITLIIGSFIFPENAKHAIEGENDSQEYKHDLKHMKKWDAIDYICRFRCRTYNRKDVSINFWQKIKGNANYH